ncbi:hypothetical protein AN958_03668 [Leucoagaricus sp. SymC.cos]|nr:hypothetical protein AN958_03668 [Leucoagaricus sp. SymC.cos]
MPPRRSTRRSAPSSASQVPADESGALLAQIQHWESVIKHATEERARCLQQMNDLRSPLRRFPDEVLGTVFEFSCPPLDPAIRPFCDDPFADDEHLHDDDWPKRSREMEDLSYRHFPVVLGAVSKKWRQHQASRLYLYLANSKALSFTLDLDLRKYTEEMRDIDSAAFRGFAKDVVDLAPLEHVFFGNMTSKIQLLRLSEPPLHWMPLVTKYYAHVLDLSVGWEMTRPASDCGLALQEFVSLSRLNLIQLPHLVGQAPFPSTLTSIHLTSTSLEARIVPLLECPQLVEYFANYWQDPTHITEKPLPAALAKPLELPSMRRFGWVHVVSTWNDALLQNLRLPNLEHLQWSGVSDWGETSHEIVTNFFSRLPETVKSFAIDNEDMVGPIDQLQIHSYCIMFLRLPHTERLSFISPQNRFVHDIFKILLNILPDGTPSLPGLLPKLKAVRINRLLRDMELGFGEDYEEDYEEEIRSSFKDVGRDDDFDDDDSMAGAHLFDERVFKFYPGMFYRLALQRNKEMNIPSFRLELPRNKLERAKGVMKAIKRSVKRGVQIEVVEGSELINWASVV